MTDLAIHLDDGTLVRVLDGRLAPGENPEHLAECDRCLARLEELEAASAAVALALRAEPKPGPAARPHRRRLPRSAGRYRTVAAAAVAVALLGGALVAGVPGLRASLAELLGLGPPPSPPVTAPAISAETMSGHVEASFVPAGDTVTVAVETHQAAGELLLVPVRGSTATVRAASEAGEPAELVILPGGVAVRNRPGSEDGYEVRVPEAVGWVVVTIGARRVTAVRRDVLRDPLAIPLSRP